MVGESVRLGLRQDGFTVDWIATVARRRLLFANGVYDVLLLDLGLPDGRAWRSSARCGARVTASRC